MRGALLRRALLIVGFCGLLVPRSADAQQERELARSGEWELVKVEDPFAEIAVQCQLRTTTATQGGRRERPLIIFDLTSNQIVVRPDRNLQGSLQANRALKGDTGDQGGRQPVMIHHGIRIDGNKLYTVDVREDGSSSLEVRFGNDVFAALVEEAATGQKIYYLWSVETSRRAYDFSIAALQPLIPTARQECAKQTGK